MNATGQPQEKYKRRFKSVLIHKPMQREFTLVVISLLIVSALAVGFVIHYTLREAMMGGGYRFGKISPYEVMSEVSYDLVLRVSMVLFATLLLIAVFGVFFLHRIAGPVYRFRSILRRVAKGEIPDEFKLREGDFFTETAEDLNVVLQILRSKRQKAQDLQKRFEEVIQKNSGSPITNELSSLKEGLQKLH